jgi:hypothetical protein
MRRAAWVLLCAGALLTACHRSPDMPADGSNDAPMTATIRTYAKHPMYRIIETPPESPYEEALDAALRISMIPDGMQQVCAQWFPEYGRDVADAFVAWRKENQPVLDELRARSTAVWTRRAGTDAAYVKMVYPHIRKDIVDALMRQSDTVSTEDFKATCARYPSDVRLPNWDLAKRLRDEMRVIRAQAIGAQGKSQG